MRDTSKAGAAQRWRRRLVGRVFLVGFCAATLVGVVMLVLLLASVARQGIAHVNAGFLTSYPSRFPERAGIKSALWGTVWVIGFTALFSIPVGVGAAVYLEEYARPSRLSTLIDINIANLAGVPSIVYGILGLVVLSRWLLLGRSVITGALTLGLVILPVIIVASREALKAVPTSLRQAAYALGATRWQTIRAHVLPAALPGILTGVILAMSRAIGEVAPLIAIGAMTYVANVPKGPMDTFTVLPIQIFDWTDRPQKEFHELAAAAILVLLAVLLTMNGAAIFIRHYFQRYRA